MAPGGTDTGKFFSDERGISTNLSYVLTAAVAAILISVLIGSVSGFVQNQQENVARQELKVVGHRVAAQMMAADRMTAERSNAEIMMETDAPTTIAGEKYTIEVDTSTEPERLILTTAETNTEVVVEVQFNDQAPPVANTEVSSGDIRIVTEGGEITLKSDS